MVAPAPLSAWAELAQLGGRRAIAPGSAMPPTIPAASSANRGGLHPGYREIGKQAVRLDIAEKLVREAHNRRLAARGRTFALDSRRAVSMGLTPASHARLLRLAGFRGVEPKPLARGAQGPPAPLLWRWRPSRPARPADAAIRPSPPVRPEGAFAALAELVR